MTGQSLRGYQHIVVSGTPYERGVSHGQQVREKIHTNLRVYGQSSALPATTQCLEYIDKYYLPALRRYYPHGLNEIRGIADGAAVTQEEIVLLNARYDLARMTGQRVGECTSMAYNAADGTAYVAQNWDMASWLHDLDTIIVLESRLPSGMTVIGLTEAGQLARSGLNSAGLGICANSLWCTDDSIPSKPVLPLSLARRMFLDCRNIAEGVKLFHAVPRHVSGNVVIASPELALNLELAPDHTFTVDQSFIDDTGDLLVTHANHFISPASSAIRDGYPGGSSIFRHTRLAQLLTRASKKRSNPQSRVANGHSLENGHGNGHHERCHSSALTVDDLKSAFADHASFPRSLCEHPNKGEPSSILGAPSSIGGSDTMTVACVIYDLAKLKMHVCKGNPCEGKSGSTQWDVYAIGG